MRNCLKRRFLHCRPRKRWWQRLESARKPWPGQWRLPGTDDRQFRRRRCIGTGLRAQERRVGPIVPNGSTYYVNPGPDPGTSLAWWNFDWSGYWDGAASRLDHLYLTIGVNGGPGSQFDLLADPQDSSNLAYGWVSPFDMNAPDTYQFSLTAVKSGFDSKTVSMDVDVVAAPEPSELALSTVIFGAILILLRRRKLAA